MYKVIQRSTQPQQAARIDWTNSLARGIISGFVGTEQRDVVTDVPLIISGNAALNAINKYGRAGSTRGSQASFYGTARQKPTTEGTILWLGKFYGGVTPDACIGGITYDASNSSPFVTLELKCRTGFGQVACYFSDGATFRAFGGGSYAAGDQSIIARVKGGTQELRQNGTVIATATLALANMTSTSTSRLEVGESLNARIPDSECSLMLIWNRYLSDAEILELQANPWQVFQAPSRYPLMAGYITGGASNSVGSSSLTFSTSAVGASTDAKPGTSSLSFSTSGVGASTASVSGSSSLTFSASGAGASLAGEEADGASSLTFTASGVGASTAASVGSASLTFSVSGTPPTVSEAVGTSSLTFDVQGYSPQTETQVIPLGGGAGRAKKRRFILPDGQEVYATQQEVYDLLEAYVRPKDKKKKKTVVRLQDQIEVKETTEKAPIEVKVKPVSVFEPDKEKYTAAVFKMARRRRTLELLLLAA